MAYVWVSKSTEEKDIRTIPEIVTDTIRDFTEKDNDDGPTDDRESPS